METQDQQSYHYWPLQFDKHERAFKHMVARFRDSERGRCETLWRRLFNLFCHL